MALELGRTSAEPRPNSASSGWVADSLCGCPLQTAVAVDASGFGDNAEAVSITVGVGVARRAGAADFARPTVVGPSSGLGPCLTPGNTRNTSQGTALRMTVVANVSAMINTTGGAIAAPTRIRTGRASDLDTEPKICTRVSTSSHAAAVSHQLLNCAWTTTGIASSAAMVSSNSGSTTAHNRILEYCQYRSIDTPTHRTLLRIRETSRRPSPWSPTRSGTCRRRACAFRTNCASWPRCTACRAAEPEESACHRARPIPTADRECWPDPSSSGRP